MDSNSHSSTDSLTALIEANAELIAGYDEENIMLTAIIGGSAEAMDARSEEDKGEVVSNVAEMLESVRREHNMSPKLFEFFIELCLEKRKFIIPVLAFALGLREEDKVKRLERDKELSDELARWLTVKLVPGGDLLLSPPAEKPMPAEKPTLTLKQQFAFSRNDTLLISTSPSNARGNTCFFRSDINTKAPPPEIVEIKEIENITIEFCKNLDLAATFMLLGDVPNLKNLWLKNCNIREIPAEIWALYRLSSLSFSSVAVHNDHEFTTFPPEIEHLENLRELNLGENTNFKRFPPEIAKLKNLTSLNLRGFFRMPENVALIPNLKHLYLVYSYIGSALIEPLLDRDNPLESVTVGEHFFESFRQLKNKYPHFSVGSEQTSLRESY